jgi:hypothetical protein
VLQKKTRTETVRVEKTFEHFKDYAIIVRQNGDAYALAKGIGCPSLWRYEGKKVLIKFFPENDKKYPQLLIPDIGEKCDIWHLRHLNLAHATCIDHRIRSISNKGSKISSGSIIVLEDGTVWEVVNEWSAAGIIPPPAPEPGEKDWNLGDKITICGDELMINLRNGRDGIITRLK